MLPASNTGNIECRSKFGSCVVFVGRETELATLRSWWEGKTSRPALVWGRRRVGKTALIQRFAEERDRVVFHTGTGDLEAAELTSLSYEAAEAFPRDLRDLAAAPYHDWRDALDHLARMAESEPLLLVLDEFPELIESSPALPGILRAFLDRNGDRTGLRILVCGSAVRTMWSVQETRSPLYGRFDLALPLYPFRPAEAAAMLPGLSGADRALVYGILGGMPLYLSWWDENKPVLQNLERLAGGPGSPILTEGELIMSIEVGGAEQSAFALHAIANGRTRYSEIEQAIKADPSRILTRLTEARLIERVTPVLADPRQSRRPIYRIADNFLSFYLGPLGRYRGQLDRGRAAAVMPALLRHLDNHMGPVYEACFREHLWRLALAGNLGDDVVEIGPWWDNESGNEIDAVVLAEPDLTRVPVLVGEAKWRRVADGQRIEWVLDTKAAALGADPSRIRHAVCAREEVRNSRPDTLVVTAADIFAP
jgi:AAA+ ATPase superfamily predicted ATPase